MAKDLANEIVNRVEFETKLFDHYKNNGNRSVWDNEQVRKVIQYLREWEDPKIKRTPHHRHYSKLYEIVTIGSETTVIKRRQDKASGPLIFLVPIEDYYDKLMESHLQTGHGGRDRMMYFMKEKWVIAKFACHIFVSCCKSCNLKRVAPQTGVVVKPIVTFGFNSRAQVDLIDFQSCPDGIYKWLMVYQDHATKFLLLTPLEKKEAAMVASELNKIFYTWGAPRILQSDNGKEFTAKIIEEMTSRWPHCKIVHGRPRHPQSQGSVERSNADIKNMLRTWITDNNSSNWSTACYEIQWQKNTSFHRVLKRSPYEAVLGQVKYGAHDASLLEEILEDPENDEISEGTQNEGPSFPGFQSSSRNTTESNNNEVQQVSEGEKAEDLPSDTYEMNIAPAMIAEPTDTVAENEESTDGSSAIPSATDNFTTSNGGHAEQVASPPMDTSPSDFVIMSPCENSCGICNSILNPLIMLLRSECNMQVHPQCGVFSPDKDDTSCCSLCARAKTLMETREDCHKRQKIQASKMVNISQSRFPVISIGDTITLTVPDVDRGPLDYKNIFGIVCDIQNGAYQIGTRDGLVKGWFPRTEIAESGTSILSLDDVPKDKSLTLREALAAQSLTGGQGFKKCNCQANVNQCKTKRCACFKSKVLCNSRCHKSSTCCNK